MIKFKMIKDGKIVELELEYNCDVYYYYIGATYGMKEADYFDRLRKDSLDETGNEYNYIDNFNDTVFDVFNGKGTSTFTQDYIMNYEDDKFYCLYSKKDKAKLKKKYGIIL